MKLPILLLCCLVGAWADSQAESSEQSSTSTKLSSAKTTLNSIPSAPAQKTTLIQQQHQHLPVQQQPQQQYIPQYVFQKPAPVQHQHQHQPTAMLIIAQPGGGAGGPVPQHSPLFQQAVHQLLSYYNNNPQAKYQLLQQQQGPGGLAQHAPQGAPHHPHFPTGALHVIPSPQLDAQTAQQQQQQQAVQHYPSAPAQLSQLSHHQPTYVIPAQSLHTLQGLGISPAMLTQLAQAQQAPQPQPQHIPVQFAQPQAFPGHLFAQQIPQFAQHQIPAGHFALAPQFAQVQLPAQHNFQIGGSGPAQLSQAQFSQAQLGAKQTGLTAQGAQTEYQTEKSHQTSASSSYNPVYRTAYVKG